MAQSQRSGTWVSVLFLSLALLGGALLLGRPAAVSASCGGTTNVASETDLNNAIAAFNAAAAGCVFTINQTAAITLSANTATIANPLVGSELIIDGNNFTIDANLFDAFTASGSKVTADELNILDANYGILTVSSDLTVTDSLFTNGDNDAIQVDGGTADLSNVEFVDNSIAVHGDSGTIVADDLRIDSSNNMGIYLEIISNLTLTRSTITNTDGNAIYMSSSTATVSDSTLSSNFGTGVFGLASVVNIINSTITNNGAAGLVQDGTLRLTNATVSGNIYGVQADSVDAVVTTLTISNSILADTLSADCSNFLYGNGSFNITINNSLFEDTDADACGLAAANPDANGNIVGEEAYLGNLANYGGLTQTIPLLVTSGDVVATSPAIDAGDNALALDENNVALAFDQRGTGFPRIVNSTVDMGAYEGSFALDCSFPAIVLDEAEWNDAILCYNLLTTPGSYTITFGADIDLSASSVTIDNPIAGIDLTVEGDGYTLDALDIPEARPIRVAADSDVTINDLTITGGNMDFVAVDEGGGIFNEGNLTLNRVTVTGNFTADDGGGIHNDEEGTMTIVDSTIQFNTAGEVGGAGDGGGIHNEGFMTITDSRVVGNLTQGSGGNHGGGIYNEGQLTLTRSTVSGNAITGTFDESTGGGIDTEGSLTVVDSTIAANTITAASGSFQSSGGGIHFIPDESDLNDLGIDPELIIINSTISGNSVTAELNAIGGAIYAGDVYTFDTVVKIINTTISDNSVTVTNGGGAALTGGAAFISKSDPPQSTLTVTIDNTIMANSTTGGVAGGDCAKSAEVFFDSNYSLYEDTGANACAVVNAVDGNITGSDPVLSGPANFGGPTFTYMPQAGSPAIDSGDNALALDPTNPLTADQRGYVPRIVNVIVDRGSVEVGAEPPANGFCPIADPAVGTTMTDLIGTGQGSKTKGYRTRKLVVPFSSDVVALYGQLASTDIGVMKYVRFLPQGYPKIQIYDPTSYAYKAYAISWWGSDLPADATWVKGQFFWGAGGNKSPRAFVLWPTYEMGEDYANAFTTFDTSMENHVAWETGFIPTQTQVVAIPEVQADGATVVVRAAVVDNDKDNRPIFLDVTVGTQTQSNADLVPNAKDTLNLYELTFTNVEAGVDEVTIYLESPVPDLVYLDGGDSAAMIGAAVSYRCAEN